MAPFAAALLNRFGLRNVVLAALLTVVSALLLSLAMTQIWQLILLWGVVVGIGTGMTALVLGATISARWFASRRGLVVGILTASTATGQLVFLPLLASLTERLGWRAALALMCVMLGVAAFAVSMVMRDRPSDVGLRPFGDPGTGSHCRHRRPTPRRSWRRRWSALRDAPAAATPVFWILFATFFICGASTNGLVQVHLIPMCLDFGVPQVQAASLLAAMGIFDFVGTIASGWLSDRYDCRKLLFWYYGLRGLSLLILPFTNFSFYGLSLFAMFYGLDWIATVPPTVRLTAQRFGPERANPGVRLDFCRPSDRRGHRCVRRRPVANRCLRLPTCRRSSSPAPCASWRPCSCWRFRDSRRWYRREADRAVALHRIGTAPSPRHAQVRPGHPRLYCSSARIDVDGGSIGER